MGGTYLYLVFILLFAILILIILIFTEVFKLIFRFNVNSEKVNINVALLWLYPFIKIMVANESADLAMTVYLFNKKVYRKVLGKDIKKPKSKTNGLIRQIELVNVNVNARYGFRDPFTTGVACGAMNIATQFINIDAINHNPDFAAEEDYIYVDATAKANLGLAIMKLFKAKN
jgi:hypothetical protein